jgi:hypothetical protein
MGWGDLFGSLVKGVIGDAVGGGIADAAMSWVAPDEDTKRSPPPQLNATLDRVLTGKRVNLNVNDR